MKKYNQPDAIYKIWSVVWMVRIILKTATIVTASSLIGPRETRKEYFRYQNDMISNWSQVAIKWRDTIKYEQICARKLITSLESDGMLSLPCHWWLHATYSMHLPLCLCAHCSLLTAQSAHTQWNYNCRRVNKLHVCASPICHLPFLRLFLQQCVAIRKSTNAPIARNELLTFSILLLGLRSVSRIGCQRQHEQRIIIMLN